MFCINSVKHLPVNPAKNPDVYVSISLETVLTLVNVQRGVHGTDSNIIAVEELLEILILSGRSSVRDEGW